MLNEAFVVLGAAISTFGSATYLIATIKGAVQPNRVTWLIWSLVPFIALSAQLNQGVGLQSLLTFMTGFNPLLIFLASFLNRESYWKLGRLDITCGAISIIGLFLWYITQVGNTAIVLSIVADGFAGIPTIVKSYRAPETEDPKVYLLVASSAAITLLTIKVWSFEYFGWPLYILTITLLIAMLVRFRVGKLLASTKQASTFQG